jgi:hypothetical protein
VEKFDLFPNCLEHLWVSALAGEFVVNVSEIRKH